MGKIGLIVLVMIMFLVLAVPLAVNVPERENVSQTQTQTKPAPDMDDNKGLVLSPTIIRRITVIRDGVVVANYTKVGDPFTRAWHVLLADWVLGLQYTSAKLVTATVSGLETSWFDTEYDGRAVLHVYLSNNASQVSYTATSLPPDTREMALSVSKSISTDTEYIWVITASYTHTEDANYTVRAVYVTLETNTYGGSPIEYLILADTVSPEIVLENGDTVSVSWYIKMPRQKPVTDTFMGLVSYLLGRTENSFSITADFGRDGGSGDSIHEALFIEPVSASGIGLGKVGIYKYVVSDTSDGITVTMYAQYTASQPVTVTSVNVYLYTDSDKYGQVSSYQKILVFDLDTPVSLDAGEVMVVKLTVSMPNQFSS